VKMLIKNKSNGKIVAPIVLVANNFSSRLKGLMFADKIVGGDGLLITECKSIHTFFMCFPIDVLFLSHDWKIVKIIRALSPWRLTWFYWRSSQVLELPAGFLPQDLREGEQLEGVCLN